MSRDDADESAEKGYWRTIRPEGTDGSDSCFYAAKRYPITDTLDTDEEELPEKFKFGW